MNSAEGEHPRKVELRASVLAERAAVPEQTQNAEARALVEAARTLPAAASGNTICCYVPFGPEPGSSDLLDSLVDAGARLLLPVIPQQRGPLDWAPYTGASSLQDGPLRGLKEPSEVPLGPPAIAQADLVLVPALSVDTAGIRLGRGGGYYDRSLPLTTVGAELIAIVRDPEFVDTLPAQAHDIPMTGVLTPSRGLIQLPRTEQRTA